MTRVFLCYRVGDGHHAAALAHQELSRKLGADNVFYASTSVPAGTEFRPAIFQRVRECDVFLVLIGPMWTTIADERGRRKLDNPHDWVREEVRLALSLGKHVVPVLLDATAKPPIESLPADIAPILDRHLGHFRAAYASADLAILLDSLRPRRRRWPLVLGAAAAAAAIVTTLVVNLGADPPRATPARVVREGSVLLTASRVPCTAGDSHDKIDFDSGQPGHGKQAQTPCAPPGGLAELILEDTEVHTADTPRLVLLPGGPGRGSIRDDAATCVDALADPAALTHRIALDRLTEGSGVCVRTTDRAVAAVVVTAPPRRGELRIAYRVWQP